MFKTLPETILETRSKYGKLGFRTVADYRSAYDDAFVFANGNYGEERYKRYVSVDV